MDKQVLLTIFKGLFKQYFEEITMRDTGDTYYYEFIHKNPSSNIYLRYIIDDNSFSCIYSEENLRVLLSNDMNKIMAVIEAYNNFKETIIAMFRFIKVEKEIDILLLDEEKSDIFIKNIKNYKWN